ncbi:hypothetical protein DPMN_191958 [Dreissena polymorpha]|uniref:Uncharacterized protein n=1 Tax=Dreissena polymorpha TaxID=45954 RepID=A0A9D4BD30_DREPO|nr:hypothetical protein DPMN_191958 [Dreissena polymorpha]
MRGRGARRKAVSQKRSRSISPDGNRLNEGDKANLIDFETLLKEAEIVSNALSTGIVPSEPLHVCVFTFQLQRPTQSTMPVAFDATTANAAMSNIRTVSDEIAAHIPDQCKQQIGRG